MSDERRERRVMVEDRLDPLEFRSHEWARELSHADYEDLATMTAQLLADAPLLAPLRFPYALAERLNQRLAQQRGGPEAARLRRLWSLVVGRPRDARTLQARCLASAAVGDPTADA